MNDGTCMIMMACYNGEKYIQKQLDSIINQTYTNWRLIIRDDGSSDGTINILNEYTNKDKRIKVIINNSNKHGAYLNFWTLVDYVKRMTTCDYYFFCDQDDIWKSNKIECMIGESQKVGSPNEPMLIYTDIEVINENDEVVLDSLNQVMGIGKINGYSLLFSHGFLYGCDLMFTKGLLEITPAISLDNPWIDIMSHDNYFGKVALLKGKIVYIDKVGIQYRRHDSNVTGNYNMKLSPSRIMKRALGQFDDLCRVHARVYNQTIILLHKLNQNLEIESYIRKGGIKGAIQLAKYKVRRKQFSRTMGIYMIMLSGKYKKYLIDKKEGKA